MKAKLAAALLISPMIAFAVAAPFPALPGPTTLDTVTPDGDVLHTASYGPHGEDWGATGANPFSFGATDSLGWTDSASYQGSQYTVSRISSAVARESLITAATLGVGSAARGDSVAAKAAYDGVLAAQAATGGYQIGQGIQQVANGEYESGAVNIVSGGLRVSGSIAGARSIKSGNGTSTYGTTPEGRPLTKHYATETGPKRNIPGSVVDNTVNTARGVPTSGGKTVHYDPVNNITVVTGNGDSIVSVHKGPPRAGQY